MLNPIIPLTDSACSRGTHCIVGAWLCSIFFHARSVERAHPKSRVDRRVTEDSCGQPRILRLQAQTLAALPRGSHEYPQESWAALRRRARQHPLFLGLRREIEGAFFLRLPEAWTVSGSAFRETFQVLFLKLAVLF